MPNNTDANQTIAQKVAEIVKIRTEQRLPVVRDKKKLINDIKKVVEDLKRFKDSDIESIKDSIPLLYDYLRKLDLKGFIDRTDRLHERLEMLEGRFGRDKIQIALVGHARHGKSTILQKISDLGDDVIPTSSYSDCTGAISIIENTDEDFSMEIEYYSPNEFIDAVNKKLEQFGVAQVISSLSDIPNISINADDDKKKAFKEDYIDGYHCYVGCLLGQEPKSFDKQESVIEYVAKYKLFGTDEQIPEHYNIYRQIPHREDTGALIFNEVRFNKFVAVKVARIKHKYEAGDVGKIVIIDTIGLGNKYTKEEDVEKMKDVLANETDIAIYNFRIPREGTNANPQWVCDEIDGIYNILDGYQPEKWVVCNINRIDRSKFNNDQDYNINGELLKTVAQNIGGGRYGKNMKPLAHLSTVNAFDADEVRKGLVYPVLSIIRNNIEDIDKSFVVDVNIEAAKLYDEYNKICETINDALNELVVTNENFYSAFEKNYEGLKLRTSLEAHVKKMAESITEPCELIIDDLKPQIDKLSEFVPKKSEIVVELNKMGPEHAHPITVFNYLMDSLRANVLSFMKQVSAESILKIQEKVKNEITNILFHDGLLNRISLKSASREKATLEWLDTFCKENLRQYSGLYSAFRSLLDFRMNIEGYMYGKCILACEPLRSTSKYKLPDKKEGNEVIANAIWQALKNSVTEVKKNIRRVFNMEENIVATAEQQKETAMPNLLLWCMADTFQQELIFAGYGKTIKKFYFEYATSIWKDEISSSLELNNRLSKVYKTVSMLNEYNDKNKFCLNIE